MRWDWQEDVERFHEESEQPAPTRVDFAAWPGDMRIRLMREELGEIEEAWGKLQAATHLEEREKAEAALIDGFVDLAYVTIGSAVAAGVWLQPFWEEVHASNMSKVDGSLGPIQRRPDGKITKPSGWKGPDILRLLRLIRKEQEDYGDGI